MIKIKLIKVLEFYDSMLKDGFLNFTSKQNKLKLKLSESYIINDGEEKIENYEVEILEENKSRHCKQKNVV